MPEGLTPEERIRLWADLTDTCEQFLLAGLRREVDPTGDVEAACRQWYRHQIEEHDRAMQRMVAEFNRRWSIGGR